MARDRILHTAFHLFYQRGFHATGLDVIAEKAGVTRQTLYNHFESRDALILEVIKERDLWWRDEFKKIVTARGGDNSISQLRSIAPAIRDWIEASEFQGCLFINAAAEFPNPRDPAHRTARKNMEAIEAVIQEIATRAGIQPADTFARKLLLIIEGAIITKVIHRASDTGCQLCDLADLLINAHAPKF